MQVRVMMAHQVDEEAMEVAGESLVEEVKQEMERPPVPTMAQQQEPEEVEVQQGLEITQQEEAEPEEVEGTPKAEVEEAVTPMIPLHLGEQEELEVQLEPMPEVEVVQSLILQDHQLMELQEVLMLQAEMVPEPEDK